MFVRSKLFGVIMLLVTFAGIEVSAQAHDVKILHRKIVQTRELIVNQGPLIPLSAIADLLTAEAAARLSGCFALTVELRDQGKPLICLWSKVIWLDRDSPYDDFEVLDLLVLPDRLVLVTAGPSSHIAINQIGLYLHIDRTTGLRPADWSLLAAMIPAVPGRLGAKLTYNQKEQRIEVEITDHLEDTKQHTLFEQKGEDWQFTRVKQWQENVPNTNPAP